MSEIARRNLFHRVLSNGQFFKRVVSAKKGKGSYKRNDKHKNSVNNYK